MCCVHNLELLDLELKNACMDILALCKEKTKAQAYLVATQFEVLVTKSMLEKKNSKLKFLLVQF